MEEWLGLPWWQQRLYVDGLAVDDANHESSGTAAPGGPGVVLSGDHGELSALGIRERNL